MSFTLGVPPDPNYIAFRDGLMKANDDAIDRWRWRWSPRNGHWYTYSTEDWILDEVGLPDTPPGSGFDLIANDDQDVERARADQWLPDLYARLGATYVRYSSRWPFLVWTWRNGGDWRVAAPRISGQVPINIDDFVPDKHWREHLNPMCVKRVDEVLAWVRGGMLTTVDGQRMIRQIVAECET